MSDDDPGHDRLVLLVTSDSTGHVGETASKLMKTLEESEEWDLPPEKYVIKSAEWVMGE